MNYNMYGGMIFPRPQFPMPRRKSNTGIIILFLTVFIILIGGGVALYFISQKSPESTNKSSSTSSSLTDSTKSVMSTTTPTTTTPTTTTPTTTTPTTTTKPNINIPPPVIDCVGEWQINECSDIDGKRKYIYDIKTEAIGGKQCKDENGNVLTKGQMKQIDDITCKKPSPSVLNSDKLLPGETLTENQKLISLNGKYSLIMQDDGNAVIYRQVNNSRPAIWATGTNGQGKGCKFICQTDGNLVIYNSSGTPVWSSGTYGKPISGLIMQNDGNLVLYNGTSPVWSSNTFEQFISFKGGKDKKYCSDRPEGISCNIDINGDWEKYVMFGNNKDNNVILIGGRDNNLCSDEGNKIICNRGAPGQWEKFIKEDLGNNNFALRGNNKGKYCADVGNGIVCNRDSVGDWERFTRQ